KRPFGPHKKTQLTFEPKAFLHRLAALIPAPYLHVTRYSGIFAPNAHRRWELSAAGIRVQKRAIAQGVDGDAKDAALRWADAPLVALGRTSRQNVQYRRAQMPTLVLGGSASARSQARGSKACSDTNPVGARRGAKLNANARNHGYAKAQPTAVKRHTNPVVTNRRAVNRPAVQRPVVRRPVVQRPVFRRPVVTARRPLRPAHGLF
ncbi:MAG: transposase, partial [Deltaproteobacteria bacterium]|nr:transposase [Deltaproteobacteria bacterium]